jgi:Cu/Ag efflux pump CusA
VIVRVSGQFHSIDDIRNVPIAAGGRVIKLGDFTTITRGYEDPPLYTVRHNGQQVNMLGVVMTNDGNIVDFGKAIEKAVASVQAELPYGVELERVADQPTVVKRVDLGIRALADGSAGDRSCGVPAEPRLAHGHRRRPFGADRARCRRAGDAGSRLEP